MNLFIILAVFTGIAAYDLPPVIKNKQWRNLALYIVFFLFILLIGILMSLDVTIPSPIKAIQNFYQNVLHLAFKVS
ncbi:hypothetical protein [Scatolibacter rhodanostii]|uniref:hypothetical protein n=1 Tax=Scatolibacter rhodanostii TaxID=2014781 RepID=UPI000C087787|nr:hypothetical protein [Scatolibacter rhodanostii]